MTSTVVDVGLALVLISAGTVTVVGVGQPDETGGEAALDSNDRAAAVAETLATTTATVTYEVETRRADETAKQYARHGDERRVHGTLAQLLASATVGNPTVFGTRLDDRETEFERALRAVVARRVQHGVQVVATWELYPGAPIAGEFVVGPRPPPETTVHAATLSVPSGLPPVDDGTDVGDTHEFGEVAVDLTTRFVAALFPPATTRLAGDARGLESPTLSRRHARLWSIAGLDAADRPTTRAGVATANRRIAVALATGTTPDLRRGFETPARALRRANPGQVTVTVRTWAA